MQMVVNYDGNRILGDATKYFSVHYLRYMFYLLSHVKSQYIMFNNVTVGFLVSLYHIQDPLMEYRLIDYLRV